MVLDTSAMVAILQSESGSAELETKVLNADRRRMSSANVLETAIVMQSRYGDAGEREVDAILQRIRVDVVPVSLQHVDMARSAFRRFGKGRHPAKLNFGDCFAYALSKALGEPLLFVGEDFGKTDVSAA